MTEPSIRALAPRLRSGKRRLTSLRLDPFVYAQVKATVGPLGVSVTTLVERLLLDFVRKTTDPADVYRILGALPRQDERRPK